ncbi:unnamed protein product [Soboliphyme baturini]|uniref:N-alpha-acetyltransferase 40 n=1 Tax=Soboliphyme baturini TaxID=241478 RepID=A0A183IVL7_9BILA|nr:unnamed protein product [Soboliphyme baturini]
MERLLYEKNADTAELIQSAKRMVRNLAVEADTKFRRHGFKLEFYPVHELCQTMFDELFGLLKENMQLLYENSSWNWVESAKRMEMREDEALYLVVFNDERLVGFTHFRFDEDYGDAVLYCYEIQVCRCWQRRGIGRMLMEVLLRMATHCHVTKVVSTVFKSNIQSRQFFRSMNFAVDSTSPESEDVDYIILSRNL